MICTYCDGRGWLVSCTAGQFAAIGRLALAGRLPTIDCPRCSGSLTSEPVMSDPVTERSGRPREGHQNRGE